MNYLPSHSFLIRTCTRITHRAAFILSSALFLSSWVMQAETPILDRDTEERLYGAITKISITYLDRHHHPVGPVDKGHGFFVTNDGTILTAAHVLIPSAEALSIADAYEISVEAWDPSTEAWVAIGAPMDSNSLAPLVVTSQELEIAECGPGRAGDALPCLKTEPGTRIDYAYLKTGHSSPYYFDFFGPFDQLTRVLFEANGWKGWVVADFDFHGRPDIASVKPISQTQQWLFQTGDGKQFHKGISGSPLVIVQQTPVMSRPLFFAGGIAASNGPSPYRDVSVVLPQDFGDDAQRTFSPGLPNGIPFSCEKAGQPYHFPLMMDYVAYMRTLSAASFNTLADCLSRHSTWSQTLGALRLIKDHPNLMSNVGALLKGVSGSNRDPIDSFIDGAKKNHVASESLSTILDLSYKAGLDPVAVMRLAGSMALNTSCEICGSGVRAQTALRSFEAIAEVTDTVRYKTIDKSEFADLVKINTGRTIVFGELVLQEEVMAMPKEAVQVNLKEEM